MLVNLAVRQGTEACLNLKSQLAKTIFTPLLEKRSRVQNAAVSPQPTKNKFYGSDDKRRSVATIDSEIYAALKVGFLFKFGKQIVKFKSHSNLSPKTLNSVGQI